MFYCNKAFFAKKKYLYTIQLFFIVNPDSELIQINFNLLDNKNSKKSLKSQRHINNLDLTSKKIAKNIWLKKVVKPQRFCTVRFDEKNYMNSFLEIKLYFLHLRFLVRSTNHLFKHVP